MNTPIVGETAEGLKKHIENVLRMSGMLDFLANPCADKDEIAFKGDGTFHHAYICLTMQINVNGDTEFKVEIYAHHLKGDDMEAYIHHPAYETAVIQFNAPMNIIVHWCTKTLKARLNRNL